MNENAQKGRPAARWTGQLAAFVRRNSKELLLLATAVINLVAEVARPR